MAERNHVVARATSPKSLSTTTHHVANLPPEEPDAGNLHVRVCEGASGQPLALLGDANDWPLLRELSDQPEKWLHPSGNGIVRIADQK
jgi:hypothetical protein